jgi:ATP-dependent exoDNAse (exonuclease V) beta subunit
VSALIDQSARERIETELDRNLGVEAGAGTGKTTVLVGRVVNLLASGTATADQLVVITFTEKAAAELSTRVRDALERRARSTHGEEHDRLLDAVRDLDRAHIETIHSFATALLRERPVEAKIDPLFEVLEGIAGQLDFDKAYERFQDRLLSEPRPELETALRRGFGLAELRQACEHVHPHRYLLPLNHPAVEEDDVEGTVERLDQIAAELRAKLTQHQPGEDRLVPVIEGILDWIDRLTALTGTERERYLVFRPAAKTSRGLGSAANWGGDKQLLVDVQERYAQEVAAAKERLRRNALLGLLPEIERFVSEYAAERRRAGSADFDDLLFWARDLLLESEPARRYFRERFKAVLIDEFQDTDPVQAELALLLTSGADPREDWRTLTPEPGRLTVVGDPKQSIYRFRRADIAVYDDVNAAALAGRQERISTNFRSNPELLRALNHVFDQVLAPEPGVQPGNVTLEAPPDCARAKRAPIVLAEGMFAGSADDKRAEEARVLAAMIHTAHTEHWQIRDRRDHNNWRECEWGDIAILLPTRTGIEYYEQALASAGIPYRHEGSRDFFERDEVRDLIWVLSAIDDPTDRLALVGALRSSAFAISDDELVIHVASAGSLSYRSRQKGASEPVDEALSELEDLHAMRRSVSLAEIARRVVERTRLVEFALTREDGEQAAANLLAIVDSARLFAAAGGGGLRPFIRYLRNSLETQADEIEATVAEETDNVVRIMTMHGAKGLEYPIVALANLGTAPRASKTPVPREDESFLHFRVGAGTTGRSGHFPTPGYEEIWKQEQAQIQAERLRLLYVAATRARDHLLIPCIVGKLQANHLLATLVHALPGEDALVRIVHADDLIAPQVEAMKGADPTENEIEAGIAERAAWIERSRELKRRASRERDIEIASSRERAQGPLAAEVATFESALVLGQGPPIPLGDAVHMVMERIALPGAANLDAVAEDVCLEGDLADDLDDVVAMCRACLKAPFVQRALAGGHFWREVPFVLSRNGDGDPGSRPLVSGRVDMVYRDRDELVVIDYKTDKDVTRDTAERYAVEHHAGQAEVYTQALSAATGIQVREVVFVYCKAGAEVRLREQSVVGVAEIG